MLDYERKHYQNQEPRSYKYLRDMCNANIEMVRQQEVVGNYKTTPNGAYLSMSGVCYSWSGKGNCHRGSDCPFASSHTDANKVVTKGKGGKKGLKGKGKNGKGKWDGNDSRSATPKGKGKW